MQSDQASWFSFLTYGWVSPYIKLAYKHGLKYEDLPSCSPSDRSEHSAKRMEYLWKEEVQQKGLNKASLKSVVWKFMRVRVLLYTFLYLVSLGLGFLGPIIFMRRLLKFCEDKNVIWWHGALWALGMAGSELVRVIIFGLTWSVASSNGIHLKSGLMTMLYKKILRLSTLGDKSIGELINIFSNESQRIFDFTLFGPMIVGGPFVATIGTGYILLTLGPSGLFGVLVFLIFYPTQYAIGTLEARLCKKKVIYTDQRIQLMSELLTCIKYIKMYAWEKPFFQTIRDIRNKEYSLLQMWTYIQSLVAELITNLPTIAVMITFLTYIGLGHDLSSSEAFTIWCVMDNIAVPSFYLPTSITSFMEMRLTLERIKSVLCMDEIQNYSDTSLDHKVALAISNASFFWPSTVIKDAKKKNSPRTPVAIDEDIQPFALKPCLIDINTVVSKGCLIGICGTVASGKTSLLSAILGQLKLDQGKVSIDGSFAYISQQAWVTNCSLQDNILFGEPFNAKKYNDVIWASDLAPDLSTLPAGDQTEIGERGINLSGGQRQRVAIARALYADKEIYLFDDPLSAVDGHTAQHIFENCLLSLLKNKTVLFVTHQLHFLSRCDEVIFMDKGRIVDQESHTVLLNRNEQYSLLIKTFVQDNEKKIENYVTDADKNQSLMITSIQPRTKKNNENFDFSAAKNNSISLNTGETRRRSNSGNVVPNDVAGNLMEAEKIETGPIPLETCWVYIKYTGGYCCALIFCIFCFINISSTAFSSWWLAHWIDVGLANSTKLSENEAETPSSSKSDPKSKYYETMYGICILTIVLSYAFRSFFFMRGCLNASNQFHHRLFQKVCTSPMRFFDSTPVGRLLNLFSRDVDELDSSLPSSLEALIQCLIFVTVTIISILLVFPWFYVALIVMCTIAYFMYRVFRCAIRDLKCMENTSRSPIYSHVAETVNGLSTILAFGKEQEFVSKFTSLVDENTKSLFLLKSSIRWLSVRLDILSACIVGITAGLVVAFHGSIPAAFAGLALVYSGQFTSILQNVVRMFVDAESSFISVQRLHTYIQTLESEIQDGADKNHKPPNNWPHMGAICFKNVQMRYQSHFPFVIKNVSFDVKPKEKIGIVGRTGSGKSSLGVCLFRLVELTSGFIEIDGIDIAGISLQDLRSKLSIIPQDPVLFIGTVRYNLDPFQKHSDHEIWRALVQTSMKNKIKSLSGKLDSMVVANGDNFSVGERQLLCMTRALLRQSKILILDEATAAIDTKTDTLLQNILSEAFKDCTVLTIAHRLSTVLSCDRILVLHDGEAIEFDRPSVLLLKMSEFSKMVSMTV